MVYTLKSLYQKLKIMLAKLALLVGLSWSLECYHCDSWYEGDAESCMVPTIHTPTCIAIDDKACWTSVGRD